MENRTGRCLAPCQHPFLETLAEVATWCLLIFGIVACLLFWMGIIGWSPLDAIDMPSDTPWDESFISSEQAAAAMDLVRPFIGGLAWLCCGGLPAFVAALIQGRIAHR